MDKVNYYYNNSHLLGIQGIQKNTISSILKRAKYFNRIKDNKKNNFLKDDLLINLFVEESAATKSLLKSDKISLKSASKLLCYVLLKVFSLNTGRISKYSPSDFTIIDIEKSWIVKGNNMLSLSSYTFFECIPMQGKVLSCGKDGIEIYQCN